MRQLNLSITQKYTLIESYYLSIENGCTCDNCGKIITNVAKVQGNDSKFYFVGLDCASTLTGIKGDFDFVYIHKANFNQAKQARAKVLKVIKDIKASGKNHKVELITFADDNNYFKQIGSGKYNVGLAGDEFNPRFNYWKQFNSEVWSKYVLPMLTDLQTL